MHPKIAGPFNGTSALLGRPRVRRRLNRQRIYFETLERRRLLSSFIWTDSSHDHTWSTVGNWTDGDGNAVAAAPDASDADVTIKQDADITIGERNGDRASC